MNKTEQELKVVKDTSKANDKHYHDKGSKNEKESEMVIRTYKKEDVKR